MTVLGNVTLWLALLLATWSVSLGLLGRARGNSPLLESSRRGALVQPVLLGLAVLSLVTALIRRDFNVAFVADHSSRNLSLPFTAFAINASWSGMLLLAAFVFSLIALPLAWRAGRPAARDPRTVVAASAALIGVLVILTVLGHPFARLGVTPIEGKGLDPATSDFTFLIVPPLTIVACAMLAWVGVEAIPSLRDRSAGSGVRLERWLVGSWLLLTIAAVADLWRAYQTATENVPWGWPPSSPLAGWAVVSVWWMARLLRTPRSPAAATLIAALALLAAAGIGFRAGAEREVRLKPGASATVSSRFGRPYVLTHMGVSRFEGRNRYVTAATLDIVRADRPIGLVTSERRQYIDILGRPIGDPVIKSGIHRGFLEDLRVVFREPLADDRALYRVRVNPLMSCVWLAAGLLVLAGLIRGFELSE